jgi:hypothetical protein
VFDLSQELQKFLQLFQVLWRENSLKTLPHSKYALFCRLLFCIAEENYQGTMSTNAGRIKETTGQETAVNSEFEVVSYIVLTLTEQILLL